MDTASCWSRIKKEWNRKFKISVSSYFIWSVPYSSQNDSSKCVLENLDIHLLINLNENSLKMVTWKIWCVLESLLNYLENEKVQAFQTLFCIISFKNGVIVFFKRKLIPWEKENNLLWEFETKLVSVQMTDILTAATVYGLNTDQSKIWLPDEKTQLNVNLLHTTGYTPACLPGSISDGKRME